MSVVPVFVHLTPDLRDRLDAVIASGGALTRSRLIRVACEEYLAVHYSTGARTAAA